MQRSRPAVFTVCATSAVFLFAALFSSASSAQGAASYPSRPVTIVLPFTPGANADLEARTYQEGLQPLLKQPVVIDYKPGASGAIANAFSAKAAPDGHTIGFINSSSTLLPALRKDLPYDMLRDFAPVIQTTDNITLLLVNADFPARNFQEYVAYAKARPGEVTWGTVGSGGAFHVSGVWLASILGLDLNFVHYKGGAPAEVDLIAGRIHSIPKQLAASLGGLKAGKYRAIAIMTRDRTSVLPDLRTVAESGAPEFSYGSWIGLVVPTGTSPAIITRLHSDMAKALRTPAAMKRWETQGSVVVGAAPEAFRKRIAAELAQWDKVVREKGIKEE